jgi:hypothetical protein
MSVADELMKLEQLRQSGTLSDAEFEVAKSRLLAPAPPPPAPPQDNSIGRAANRFVSYQLIMGIVGIVVFLIFLLAFMLPMMNRVNDPDIPSGPDIEVPQGNFP